jgi:hypothetical protein
LSLPLVVAGPSGAQSSNFVRVTGAPGTLTCAAGSVDVAGGTLALEWSVPSSEFDGVAEARVNGNVILSTPIMIPGSSGAVPATLSLTFAPVAFPYTFTVRVIPSIASFPPVGFSFSCPAAGPGTNFRILGVSAGIPALSDTGLLIVSVLLALAGGFALRRRGGRSG